jgi:hypothetical protein
MDFPQYKINNTLYSLSELQRLSTSMLDMKMLFPNSTDEELDTLQQKFRDTIKCTRLDE